MAAGQDVRARRVWSGTMGATKLIRRTHPGPCVLACRATLDVSPALAQRVACLVLAQRAMIGIRRGRRVLGCFVQAVRLLRFMRQRAAVGYLARDNDISLSTAYRYLHEALDVLAAQAPDLPEVVAGAVRRGQEHLLLDGTHRHRPRPRPRQGPGSVVLRKAPPPRRSR